MIWRPTKRSVCVHEEWIAQVRLVAVRQLLAHDTLLLFTHVGQPLLILLVEAIIAIAEDEADADLRRQTCHDGDLPRLVAWCFALLESLCTLIRS